MQSTDKSCSDHIHISTNSLCLCIFVWLFLLQVYAHAQLCKLTFTFYISRYCRYENAKLRFVVFDSLKLCMNVVLEFAFANMTIFLVFFILVDLMKFQKCRNVSSSSERFAWIRHSCHAVSVRTCWFMVWFDGNDNSRLRVHLLHSHIG